MRMRASLFAAPNLDCFASRNDGIKTRATFPVVIARLDRATQYSRDACDEIEKPQRTGYPACAEYDDFLRGDMSYLLTTPSHWRTQTTTPAGCFRRGSRSG